MNLKYMLNGNDWKLTGWIPYQWSQSKSFETGSLVRAPLPTVQATVPGAIQADLLAAGMIPDPNVGTNSLDIEWVNNREWTMDKMFKCPAELDHEKYFLCFDGLDYSGCVFLNDIRVIDFEGMFLRYEADVTGLLKRGEDNVLRVVLYQSPEVPGQMGYSDKIRKLKSRFNYTWDWCVRLVPVGIWDDVYLKTYSYVRIREFFPSASLADKKITSKLSVSCEFSGKYIFRYKVTYKGRKVCETEFEHDLLSAPAELVHTIDVDSPRAWWPNGAGEQPLYDIEVSVVSGVGDILCDKADKKRVGFKNVRFVANDDPQPGAAPYTLQFNEKKIFMQGVNWVPIKALYGCVTREDYENHLGRFRDMNCNILRVWGGAILEKKDFYDVCDEMGLLVWQEFPQSSSGICNTPSADRDFLDNVLKPTAREFILRRRHHVSHVIWCGGNELTEEHLIPVTIHHANITALAEQVGALDPGKHFLPASPSGPSFGGRERDFGKGIHHDVHGQWLYYTYHYRYNNAEDGMFKTETGAGGSARLEALEKYKGKYEVWPPDERNFFWKHRSSFWIQRKELTDFFGPWDDDGSELAQYVKSSRFLQAEAVRYILESGRRREGVQSGEIIWMGNEPFPNNTNSSMIEADGTTKPVYHWAQECFAPVRVSAKYNAIAFKSGDIFTADIYVSTSRKLDKSAAVMTEILDLEGNTLESFGWPVDLEDGSHNAVPNKVEWTIPKIKGGIFFLRLEFSEKGAPVSTNTYLYTVDGEQWFSPLRKMPAAKVAASDCGDGCLSLTNTSASAALGVFVYGADPDQFLRITPNYLILMPDETKYLTVEVTRGAKEADIRIETYNGTTDTIRMKGI